MKVTLQMQVGQHDLMVIECEGPTESLEAQLQEGFYLADERRLDLNERNIAVMAETRTWSPEDQQKVRNMVTCLFAGHEQMEAWLEKADAKAREQIGNGRALNRQQRRQRYRLERKSPTVH